MQYVYTKGDKCCIIPPDLADKIIDEYNINKYANEEFWDEMIRSVLKYLCISKVYFGVSGDKLTFLIHEKSYIPHPYCR